MTPITTPIWRCTVSHYSDIAYGIIQYYLITGDWKYIEEQGAEIILENSPGMV